MKAGLTAGVQRRVARLVVGIGLRHRLELLAARQARHRSIVEPERMARWQLEAFNEIWRRATERYRFYADWRRRHGLPGRLEDIAELAKFPVLRKSDIETSFPIIAEDAAPCRFVSTGGSTGPSQLFPRGSGDDALLYSNMYLGRSWAGIRPGDDIVLIWGHEHLYGFGAKGRLVKTKRQIMDWLIGTRRLNVYRLDEESVAAYFEAIRARPGVVVIGYVSALRKLLDFVERSGVAGSEAHIRAVVFCAETVRPADLRRAQTLLGATPLIEYGMAETGAIAYSRPDSSAPTFFWDAVHCHLTGERELVVTTLQPLSFPLINFGTEDRVEPLDAAPALPFRCARIVGRTRDVLALRLRSGRVAEVHSDLIEECLDLVPHIRSYFIHQKGETIDIAVKMASEQELAEVRSRFLREIARRFADLDAATITFSLLKDEPKTIAGKRKIVLRE